MKVWPEIAIILLTYKRTDYAIRTVEAIKQHLDYPRYRWIVADDGSGGDHLRKIVGHIGADNVIATRSERNGYGDNANWAWETSRHYSPLTLWLEDDWELLTALPLTKYVEVLQECNDIGMVRFGRLPIGLDCHTNGYFGHIYLHILASTPYMFSGNPALRHIRFLDAYGGYPTGLNPGETETNYDWQIRSKGHNVKILYPIELGEWGVFGHIGEVKSF